MLPSEQSARTLVERGIAAAAPGVLRNLAERTMLIAIGLRFAGIRAPFRPALFGALVVEAAVILWVRRDLQGGGPPPGGGISEGSIETGPPPAFS